MATALARRKLSRLFALGAVAVVLLGILAPNARGAYTATLDLNPTSGLAGATVTADGSDHTPNSTDLEIHWEAENGPLLAIVDTDANGEYTTTITIPPDAAPGTYDVVVCETAVTECTNVDYEFAVGAIASFTVDPPPTTTTTTMATTGTVPDLDLIDFDSPIGVGDIGLFGAYGGPADGFEPYLYIPRCVPPPDAEILDFDTDDVGTMPGLGAHPAIASIPHVVAAPSTSTITPRQAIRVTGDTIRTVVTFTGPQRYVGLHVGDLTGSDHPVELVARDVGGAVVAVDRIPMARTSVDTCMTVRVEGAPNIAQVEIHTDASTDLYVDRLFYSSTGDLPGIPTPVRGSVEFLLPTSGAELSARSRQLVLGTIRIPAGFVIDDVTLSVPRWDRSATDIRHIDSFPLWVEGGDQLYSFVASGIYVPQGPSYLAVTATGPGVLASGLIEVVGTGFSVFDTTTAAGRVNIEPVTLEVTQAVRGEVSFIAPGTRISERGDTVLVQNKKTVVRAFARITLPDGGAFTGTVPVNAELVGTRDGVALPGSPLAPERAHTNLRLYPDVATAYDDSKQRTDGSWNFVLPDSWTDPGSIDLRLEVNSPRLYGHVEEAADFDGVLNFIGLDDVVFRSMTPPAVNVWLVDYYYKCRFDSMGNFIRRGEEGLTLTPASMFCDGTADGTGVPKAEGEVVHAQPTLAHAINAVMESWGMAPFPGAFPATFDTWEYTFATDGVTDAEIDAIDPGPRITAGSPQEGFWLGVALRMELIVGSDGYNSLNALMTSFFRGKAWGSPSFFRVATWPSTFLHEAGHTMGLRHTGDGHGESNYVSRWNFDHGLIARTAEVVSAFDTRRMQARPYIVDSDSALHDLMSYGDWRWPSWQVWHHIQDAVGSGFARPDHRNHADAAATGAAPPRGPYDGAPPAGSDDEVVTFRGRLTDDGVELDAAFNLPGGIVYDDGDIVFRVVDSSGSVLSETTSATLADSDDESIAFAVPVLIPEGATEIVILLEGDEIDRRDVVEAPQVGLDPLPSGPLIDAFELTWSADGGTTARFLVEVSRDGTDWVPLELTDETSFEIDPGDYPFQGPGWKVRVQATSGTAIAISSEAELDFGVHPTEPIIALPTDGSTVASNTFIPLQAAVSSFSMGEEGDLVWELDGTRVAVGPVGLTFAGDPGPHVITLTQPATGASTAVTINVMADADLDGMSDDWEIEWGLDPQDPADAGSDDDGDEVLAWQEFEHGASPQSIDTDGDDYADGIEISHGSDPANPLSLPSVGSDGLAAPTIGSGSPAADDDGGGGLSMPIIILLVGAGAGLLGAGVLWWRRR